MTYLVNAQDRDVLETDPKKASSTDSLSTVLHPEGAFEY